ncbi:hypothetical protein NDU88_012260 [Pleurodeles waltl]|uniref:Uncharacterized protein n=1 Tax=Pleurodeles waltl TaxID=8319 RepID=A0AAV7QZM3_PLEWA|nr:hypothetical protein NDU88_012260 [Pleurodeles waltl]
MGRHLLLPSALVACQVSGVPSRFMARFTARHRAVEQRQESNCTLELLSLPTALPKEISSTKAERQWQHYFTNYKWTKLQPLLSDTDPATQEPLLITG